MAVRRFWIVTPTFNSLHWLPCAIASVADQAGEAFEVHHHIQDGGSADGTCEWLEAYARRCAEAPRARYTFSFESGRDRGMYDAINKGWAKAPPETDYLVHLNSDEQYLPGALQAVAEQAEADLILGDAIVVDASGHYICHQTSVKPWPWMSRFFCVVFTCTAFYRRRFLEESGVRFDPTWRIAGDMVFYHHLIRRGMRVRLCNRPTSLFVDSGENLAVSPAHRDECTRFRREYGGPLSRFSRGIQKANTLRRLWKDALRGLSRGYEIYLPGEASRRKAFEIDRPKSLWGRKIK